MTKRKSEGEGEEPHPSQKRNRSFGTVDVKEEWSCDICAEKHGASWQCVDCGVLLCLEMSKYHLKLKANQNHRVLPVEEAQVFLQNHPLPLVMMCPDHPDKPFEYFDNTCQKLLCVSCAILGNHSGHQCCSIPEAARTGREKFAEMIGNLSARIVDLNSQTASTHSIIDELATMVTTTKAHVDDIFNGLVTSLEARRNELHEQIESLSTQKSCDLNSQLSSSERLKDSAELLLNSCHDSALIANDSEYLVRLLVSKQEYETLNEEYDSNLTKFSEFITSGLSTHTHSSLSYPPLLSFSHASPPFSL